MNLNSQLEKLIVLLSDGKISKAIEQLDCLNDTEIFRSRFKSLENDNIRGVISRETYTSESNKLILDLLEFLKAKIGHSGNSNSKQKQKVVIKTDYLSKITDSFILNLENFLIVSASFEFSNKKNFGLKLLSSHFLEEQVETYSDLFTSIKSINNTLNKQKNGFPLKVKEIIQKLKSETVILQKALEQAGNENHPLYQDTVVILDLCSKISTSLLKTQNIDLPIDRLEIILSRSIEALNKMLTKSSKFSKS